MNPPPEVRLNGRGCAFLLTSFTYTICFFPALLCAFLPNWGTRVGMLLLYYISLILFYHYTKLSVMVQANKLRGRK